MGRREARLRGHGRQWSLLELGDPNGRLPLPVGSKSACAQSLRGSREEARAILEEFRTHSRRRAMPPEVQKRGRTIGDWFTRSSTFTSFACPTAPPRPLQPHQADLEDRLRLPQLRALPHPNVVLPRPAELARARSIVVR
jgi:hypothetical protein